MGTAAILNLPEAGHMNATLPVVAEMVRRGERVLYFATERYRDAIEECGAELIAYGPDDDYAPPAHRGGLYSVMAWLTEIAERILPGLVERLRADEPNYLVVDSMCIWGRYAAEILGKRAATIASVFVPNEAHVTPNEMIERAYGGAPKETLLAGIAALDAYIRVTRRIDAEWGTVSPNLVGFFANRRLLNVLFTSREFHIGGEHFDASYEFVGPSIDARDGIAALPFELDPDRPLAYVSLGTIFNRAPELYAACFEAFAPHWQVVVSTGGSLDARSLGTAPEHFIVRDSVPQLEVLRRASLFLTHGGMNSANEALWYGVPMIVYPQHGDQHLVAARVEELGAGVRMSPADVAPARIRELVATITGDVRYADAAQALGDTLRNAGGAQRAASALIAFGNGGAS